MEIDTSLNWVQFRYTLPSECSEEEFQSIVMTLAGLLTMKATNREPGYYRSLGYEVLDKMGEETHPHIHIHFTTDVALGTIRKQLQRIFTGALADHCVGRKGNTLYSLSEYSDVRDIERFLRYPLKQMGKGRHRYVKALCVFPAALDLSLLEKCANDEWSRLIDINRKKLDSQLKKSKTKDDLFVYLEGIFSDLKEPLGKKELLRSICQFYLDEGKSANRSTIMGFYQTALWHFKIESIDETVDRWMDNFL